MPKLTEAKSFVTKQTCKIATKIKHARSKTKNKNVSRETLNKFDGFKTPVN